MSEQIDDNYVNGVYVKADGTEQVEIDPQYVYITVPSKYVCVYHKLLVLMAQYGLDMLNDCSAILTCFSAMLAMRNCISFDSCFGLELMIILLILLIRHLNKIIL